MVKGMCGEVIRNCTPKIAMPMFLKTAKYHFLGFKSRFIKNKQTSKQIKKQNKEKKKTRYI